MSRGLMRREIARRPYKARHIRSFFIHIHHDRTIKQVKKTFNLFIAQQTCRKGDQFHNFSVKQCFAWQP